MKLRLLVVGRGASELAAYETQFHKRLKSLASFVVVELPEGRAKQLNQRRQEEAKHILNAATPGFVLFDERGKSLSSKKWAEYLERLPGNAELDFVIGGASGVSDEVRDAAGAIWSLSPMTLPHQLVRVMVCEQIYRAFTIMQGHPYHRE